MSAAGTGKGSAAADPMDAMIEQMAQQASGGGKKKMKKAKKTKK